jgi:coenzyme F420-reducing hydrogenase beta subunit
MLVSRSELAVMRVGCYKFRLPYMLGLFCMKTFSFYFFIMF